MTSTLSDRAQARAVFGEEGEVASRRPGLPPGSRGYASKLRRCNPCVDNLLKTLMICHVMFPWKWVIPSLQYCPPIVSPMASRTEKRSEWGIPSRRMSSTESLAFSQRLQRLDLAGLTGTICSRRFLYQNVRYRDNMLNMNCTIWSRYFSDSTSRPARIAVGGPKHAKGILA